MATYSIPYIVFVQNELRPAFLTHALPYNNYYSMCYVLAMCNFLKRKKITLASQCLSSRTCQTDKARELF